MASLVDNIASRPDIQDKVNDAYRATGAEKLVWKDSFANGRGGPKVCVRALIFFILFLFQIYNLTTN